MSSRSTGFLLALCVAVAFAWGFVAAAPSVPFRWTRIPSITIVASPGDVRIDAVRQAIPFWNCTLEGLGAGFRLGKVTLVAGAVPDDDLESLGDQIVNGALPASTAQSLAPFPGDIIIVLSDSSFISYTAYQDSRAIIAIKNGREPPLTLPNVLHNVIAHELGHALGLTHNQNPELLMCDRPAPCRPDAFESATARIFPLSDQEKNELLRLYPSTWTPTRQERGVAKRQPLLGRVFFLAAFDACRGAALFLRPEADATWACLVKARLDLSKSSKAFPNKRFSSLFSARKSSSSLMMLPAKRALYHQRRVGDRRWRFEAQSESIRSTVMATRKTLIRSFMVTISSFYRLGVLEVDPDATRNSIPHGRCWM